MKNKINIAEILKDCPKGMELDCTIFDTKVIYQGLNERTLTHPIIVQTEYGFEFKLTQYGQTHNIVGSKCVVFPKGKTTWEGFVPPRKFKDGDILATDLGSVFLLNTRLNTDECYGCFVGKGGDGSFHICVPFAYKECCGLATEEEKEKLFQAIKDNGYKFNAETKTLEKLVEPKFKVGDKIKNKNTGICVTVIKIYKDCYLVTNLDEQATISFDLQNNWKLAPNEFDISTLIPFESRVLCRDGNAEKWKPNFFGFYDNAHAMNYPFECCGTSYSQCIPFEGNEHLLGKTDDCDEYYKIWE